MAVAIVVSAIGCAFASGNRYPIERYSGRLFAL